MITLETTLGDIVVELDDEMTPLTAQNFLTYAQSGFFDDTIFHRVIDGFMIQGGGFTEDMSQKDTNSTIENEADKGAKNERGTVAMARTNDPHSATAQFFINVNDNKSLDFRSKTPEGWGYCVFGKVVDGMDVVDQIKTTATSFVGGHGDVPVEPIVIKKVSIAQ